MGNSLLSRVVDFAASMLEHDAFTCVPCLLINCSSAVLLFGFSLHVEFVLLIIGTIAYVWLPCMLKYYAACWFLDPCICLATHGTPCAVVGIFNASFTLTFQKKKKLNISINLIYKFNFFCIITPNFRNRYNIKINIYSQLKFNLLSL